jgi:hypothetical protein
MPDDSTANLVAYIKGLYNLSAAYGVLDGRTSLTKDTNRRVMEWLRHPVYDNDQWTAAVGEPDRKFYDYVNGHRDDVKLVPLESFSAPTSPGPVQIRVAHWGATMNGVFVRGAGTSSGGLVGHGDMTGWGGDLITFYGEWLRDIKQQADPYKYCQDKLFHEGTTFKMQDLIEDVDAFNIAIKLRADDTLTINDVVSQYYSGAATPTKTRYKDFYSSRYGPPPTAIGGSDGPTDNMVNISMAMFDDLVDTTFVEGRNLLIWRTKAGDPGNTSGAVNSILTGTKVVVWMAGDKLTGPSNNDKIKLCKGYKDGLIGLMLKEAAGQLPGP